jgi:hypothetical protein
MVQKGYWLAKIKSPNSIEQKILRIVARPWSAAHFVKLHFDQLGQSPQICAASCVDIGTNNRTEYKAWPNSAARKSMTLSVEQTVHSVGFLWGAAAPNLQFLKALDCCRMLKVSTAIERALKKVQCKSEVLLATN